MWRLCVLLLLCFFLTQPLARVSGQELVIPAVGQPTPFYQAIATNPRIVAVAHPTELSSDQFTEFTVTISGLINPERIVRPNLNEIEEFRLQFQIENLPEQPTTEADSRVFRFKLRPLQTTVEQIPEFVLSYYNPNIPQPPDQPSLPFRKTRTAPIPLRIIAGTVPNVIQTPLDIPSFMAFLPPERTPVTWSLQHTIVLVFTSILLLITWQFWKRFTDPTGAAAINRKRRRAFYDARHVLHRQLNTVEELHHVLNTIEPWMPPDSQETVEEIRSQVNYLRFAPEPKQLISAVQMQLLRLIEQTRE